MIPETPIPVKEAIRIAPVDPMATGGQVTLYARQEIDRWRTEDENFQLSFDNLTESINPGEKDAFILYLASMAITLQNYSRSPVDNQNENLRRTAEGQIGRTLFNMLSKPDVQTEIQAVNKTWHAYNKSHRFRPESDNGHNIETKSPVPSEKEQDLLPLGRWLLKRLFAFEQKLITEERPPEIREYIGILEEALSICRENGIKRPPLYNLIIGNIDLTGELEPEYADVAERMGQDGLKWHRIMDRANAYEEMIKRAQENYTGYQALGLGWRGLRDRHERRRAVLGVDEGREPGVAAAQREEVDQLRRPQRIHRAQGLLLLLGRAVPAGDAVELVGGVQAEHVRERLPLQDVGVDVQLVARDDERGLAAVRELHARVEALRAARADRNRRREGLARQRRVALDPEGDHRSAQS